jgi:FMN phosphatase YigB (HAD superfamily)
MISLITTDVGNTLGSFTKPSVKDILFDLSKLPAVVGKAQIIGEEERRFLHTAPVLTDAVRWDLCGALLIDWRVWPSPWPRGGFLPYPYTNSVLAELRRIAPIAALSNVSVLGATRMDDLDQFCGRYLDNIYTSYDMRRRKPDPRLWVDIADVYGVPVSEVVHIGDRWVNDICGAYHAGASAIYLTGTRDDHNPIPPHDEMTDRIAIVNDLRDAPAVIRAWCSQDRPPINANPREHRP